MKDVVNFTYSYSSDRNFDIEFNKISRPLMSWPDEIVNTLENIRSITDKPLFLCLSGGIDGEVIARTCIKHNFKFEVISLRHTQGTNDHDVNYAIDFCKTYNIKHHIIDFDIHNFIINEIPKYIEQGYVSWRTFRFQQIYLFELAEAMGGTAVLGGGEQTYFTVDNEICLNFKDDFFMCLEWLRRNNKIHFPFFHMQNPEIFASYMKIDIIDNMLKDPSNFVDVPPNVSYEKMEAYSKYFPDMPRREKYDGFEKIKGSDFARTFIKPRKKSQEKLKEKNIPINLIKQQLGI